MNLYAVVLIIAVGTAGLAGLIVLADIDLWVQEKFHTLNTVSLTRQRPEPPIHLELAVVRSEPAAPQMRFKEMSEGERWMASMAAYAPPPHWNYRSVENGPGEDGDVSRMPEAG